MTLRAIAVVRQSLGSDLRLALRQIGRSPSFSLAVILVLASGFALSTAMFSAVRSVLLAPLPYRQPDRLVQIISDWPKTNARNGWSAPLGDVPDLKAGVAAFEDVAAYRYSLRNLSAGGRAESTYGVRISANLLPMLGVHPKLGAWFPVENDRPGNTHVVLLSDDLWRRAFHADPRIVGKTIRLDDESYVILGVMPDGFNFPMKLATAVLLPTDQMQFWMPLGADYSKEAHGSPNAGVIARLKPGVGLAAAEEQLRATCVRLQHEYPATNTDLSAVLVSLQQQTIGQVSTPLLALFAAAALILLLSCVNVAALLLARGEARATELAVRMALGASARRVACLPLLYGFLLCCFGCLAGVPLSFAALRILVRLAPLDVPRLNTAAVDGRGMLLAVALALFCGALVGSLNALQVLRRSPRAVLSDAARGHTGKPRARLRSSLVVGQVSLAVLLVAGAGLMLRTFLNLLSADAGYDPHGVFYGISVLPQTRYAQVEQRSLFFKKVLDQLRATPGVAYAAVSTGFPFVGQYDGVKVQTPELASHDRTSGVAADFDAVSPEYLEAMGVRLVRGRLIRETDGAAAPKVAVIDTLLAEKLWPGQNPLGKRIDTSAPAKPDWRQVVGVVEPMRNRALDAEGRPGVFAPLAQAGGVVNFVVLRSSLAPRAAARRLREAVSAVDPDQGVFFAQSMPELVQDTIAIRRFVFIMLAFFGLAAVVHSGLGLYGLVSFLATRRTREVGIRVALGASRASIAALVVSDGLRLTVLGVLAGTIASFLLSGLLSGLLYGVRPFDTSTLLMAIALLASTAAIAALIPAWRTAKLDPMKALRTE